MKKYFCDRCGTPLVIKQEVVPHYDMKDPQWKHISRKKENFVCEACVEKDKTRLANMP